MADTTIPARLLGIAYACVIMGEVKKIGATECTAQPFRMNRSVCSVLVEESIPG